MCVVGVVLPAEWEKREVLCLVHFTPPLIHRTVEVFDVNSLDICDVVRFRSPNNAPGSHRRPLSIRPALHLTRVSLSPFQPRY